MAAELQDILLFLDSCPPFDELPEEAVREAAAEMEVSYYRAGTTIYGYGNAVHHLYIIRRGAVEISRRNGTLYNRLEENDIFGQMGLLMNNVARLSAKAIEDTLVYCLPENQFHTLCSEFEHFSDFVELEDSTRLRQAVATTGQQITTAKIKTLLTGDPVVLKQDATVQQAAMVMEQNNISAVLIESDKLQDVGIRASGILTDRDMCTRVLATGLSSDTPVRDIMSRELLCLDQNAYIYEAMLLMLRNNIKHLPVIKGRKPVGIIEHSDIVRYESQHSLLLVNTIFQQSSLEDLIDLSPQVQDSFVRMVNEDANSHMIGTAMSVIGRSFIQRIIELAVAHLGDPPVPFCFLIFGSMARDEQLVVTDQDNGLLLHNDYDPQHHEKYFETLADYVCDGLDKCGYHYCSGDIMATNPEWRKTTAQWKECFTDWIDNPKPQALLNSSIFFDLDGVYGMLEAVTDLQDFIVERAGKNKKFLACLARNAINRTPPLGFFKTFVLETDGKHKNSINLKRRGTAPLSDLVRVHALAAGSKAINTFERMDDVIESTLLPEGKGEDLRDAMEFISLVRIRHQAKDIESNREADNNVEPTAMSDFERRHLKDAFQILSNAQNFIKYRYHSGN